MLSTKPKRHFFFAKKQNENKTSSTISLKFDTILKKFEVRICILTQRSGAL